MRNSVGYCVQVACFPGSRVGLALTDWCNDDFKGGVRRRFWLNGSFSKTHSIRDRWVGQRPLIVLFRVKLFF